MGLASFTHAAIRRGLRQGEVIALEPVVTARAAAIPQSSS
jgi:hypothetical protein